MKYSERIKAFLKVMEWSPADLARATKLSAPTLSQILSDERPNPGAKVLEALVKNTEIDAVFLLTGQGNPRRASKAYPEGLPLEIRAAVQKAVQMVEDFISVVPAEKRLEDRVKKGLYVMLVADLLIAGRQEEIPDTMKNLLRAFARPPGPPEP